MGGGRRDLGDGVWFVLAGGGNGLLGVQDLAEGSACDESSAREAARPHEAGSLRRREPPVPTLRRERAMGPTRQGLQSREPLAPAPRRERLVGTPNMRAYPKGT